MKLNTISGMVKCGSYVASYRREGDLWEIRNRDTLEVIAHEANKKDALKVLRKLNNK